MTTAVAENLLNWLKDAHAMEQQAESMLKAQAGRIEHYPDLKARIEQHLQETLGQKQILEDCIARLDSSPSVLKDLSGRIAAFGQAVGGMTQSDEVIKGAMAGYVFENLEIATYTTLIAAARQAGDTQTEQACKEIIEQEKAMSAWLLNQLPLLTQQFLLRDAAPHTQAKV